MKKLLLVICAALVLSIPAFAADPKFTPELTITFNDTTYSFTSGISSQPVFFFLRQESAYVYVVGFCSEYENAICNMTTTSGGNTTVNSIPASKKYRTDYFGEALRNVPDNAVFSVSLDHFGNVNNYDIQTVFRTFIENYVPPVVGSSGRFTVPCGNVAYFQVSSAQTVEFKSLYQILSRPFANSTYGYWSDSGQRFGTASSLPTSSTSFPLASQSALYWSPDPQSKNLLGLSKTGLASASCSAGQWYAFYNPAYNSNNTDFTTMDITGATVSISGSFSAIKIYPLEQVVDYQNGSFVGSSNDGYTSYYDGTVGENGDVTFTDQNGNAGTPTAGGQNLLAPNETYQSIIDKVVGLLQNIVSEIKNLFSFGYEAINDLAGLMSNFGRALSGLYSWLPSEVHAALISAVSIAIVIGVFKVFI